jgi:hypothetical protein
MNINENNIGLTIHAIGLLFFVAALGFYFLGMPVWLGACLVGGFVELFGWMLVLRTY